MERCRIEMEHHIQKLKGLIMRMETKAPMNYYDRQLVRETIKLLEKQILRNKYPNDPQYMSGEEEQEYWRDKGREFTTDPKNLSPTKKS